MKKTVINIDSKLVTRLALIVGGVVLAALGKEDAGLLCGIAFIITLYLL